MTTAIVTSSASGMLVPRATVREDRSGGEEGHASSSHPAPSHGQSAVMMVGEMGVGLEDGVGSSCDGCTGQEHSL